MARRAHAVSRAISTAGYLRVTQSSALPGQFAGDGKRRNLEGFLFPATYDVYDDDPARVLVEKQLAAFSRNWSKVKLGYARSKNLTPYDVLIIASMIEREVAVARERPLVASVIYNRLRAGMRLDIDATVQYAVGQWKEHLTASDLAIDSPYNTRKFAGLPPGPISNPGKDSIRAAAHPVETDYLYYVARNDGTGRHYFSSTPEQFAQDVQKSRANLAG
jgi:UPF0755 protein